MRRRRPGPRATSTFGWSATPPKRGDLGSASIIPSTASLRTAVICDVFGRPLWQICEKVSFAVSLRCAKTSPRRAPWRSKPKLRRRASTRSRRGRRLRRPRSSTAGVATTTTRRQAPTTTTTTPSAWPLPTPTLLTRRRALRRRALRRGPSQGWSVFLLRSCRCGPIADALSPRARRPSPGRRARRRAPSACDRSPSRG